MTSDDSHPPADLRQRAEAAAREATAQAPEHLADPSPEGIRRTLHDLRVHQIELEMQNEELRRSQVELDASRARYFDLYDLAPVGYCTINEEGLILEANLTAASMLGAPRGALVRQPMSRFILKEDQDIYYHYRKRFFETGAPQACELRMVKQDDTSFWGHLLATAAQDGEATPVSRVVLSDITERKRAEAEREALQKQLLQMQKLESVGRLAGGVAHDFNNALQTILLNIELALARIQDPGARRSLLDVKAAAQRSADLTAKLLAFARKQFTRPRVLSLNDVVADFVPMLRQLVGADIVLQFVPGFAAGPVRIDPSQIQQILTNLVDNAGHAVGGGGRITIETANVVLDAEFCANRPDLAPGPYAGLSVNDDGAGMTPEIQAHLFEPFFTSQPFGERAGLGLAAVYGIVRQNGGAVEVSSEPGLGSTFTVWLPRSTHLAGAPSAEAAALPPTGGTETILLVDDEPAVVTSVSELLSGLGYSVLAAERPSAALLLAARHQGPIHLVIADVVMPEMNGRELVERLAAVRPAVQHLFVSGHSPTAIAQRGVVIDSVQFLSKPFAADALAQRIRQVLDQPTEGPTNGGSR